MFSVTFFLIGIWSYSDRRAKVLSAAWFKWQVLGEKRWKVKLKLIRYIRWECEPRARAFVWQDSKGKYSSHPADEGESCREVHRLWWSTETPRDLVASTVGHPLHSLEHSCFACTEDIGHNKRSHKPSSHLSSPTGRMVLDKPQCRSHVGAITKAVWTVRGARSWDSITRRGAWLNQSPLDDSERACESRAQEGGWT